MGSRCPPCSVKTSRTPALSSTRATISPPFTLPMARPPQGFSWEKGRRDYIAAGIAGTAGDVGLGTGRVIGCALRLILAAEVTAPRPGEGPGAPPALILEGTPRPWPLPLQRTCGKGPARCRAGSVPAAAPP